MESGIRTLKQYDPFGNRLDIASDPEAAAKIRSKMLPEDQGLVNLAQMMNIGKPKGKYTALGVNMSPNDPSRPAPSYIDKLNELSDVLQPNDLNRLEDPQKTIMGLGAGASPQTFAHEARHNKIIDEYTNRANDVLGSNSAAQYHNNINDYYNYLVMKHPNYGYSNKDPFDKKEDTVLDYIKHAFQKRYQTDPGDIDEKSFHITRPAQDVINLHKTYNQDFAKGEEPNLWDKLSHPIDYMLGHTKETSQGVFPQTMIEDRARFPFLNFVGSNPGAVRSGYPGDAGMGYDPKRENGGAGTPEPKEHKRGGFVERTTHDRKIL